MKKFTVGSLFAGIGGIDIGFEQAGFKIAWANEYDKKACETFRYNIKKTKLFEKDIHDLDASETEYVDIITSGFPCQAFSIAGYREGFDDRKGRGNLFFETARFIEELKPKAFLLENVKNLAGHDKGNTLNVIRKTIIEDLGYSFIPFILNSKDYGNTPQNRERIYIVGFRNEANVMKEIEKHPDSYTAKFKIPDEIKLKKTIHDCIEKNKQDEILYYNPTHQYYKELSKEMTKKDTIYQWRRVYVRENKSNVCPTLTANMGTGGHNVPLILDDFGIRKLNPKECLNFQGFPKTYNYPEDMAKSHCYKQAGNSVVVPVIKRIAKNLYEVLNEE